jgi:hypothetical protein
MTDVLDIGRVPDAIECVRCGKAAPVDDERREQINAALAEAQASHPGRVTGWQPVGWCATCARARDRWTEAMEALAAGMATPDQRVTAHEGVQQAAVLHRRLNGEALQSDTYTEVTNETSRFFIAAKLALAASESRVDMTALTAAQSVTAGTDAIRRAAKGEPVPRWAGTHSYAKVYEACLQGSAVEWVTDKHGNEVLSGAGLCYLHALGYMQRAHPIVVPSRQVDILPPLTHVEAWALLRDVQLPFPAVYLDMTDEDGRIPHGTVSFTEHDPPEHSDTRAPNQLDLSLSGAVLFKDDRDGALHVIPFVRNDDDTRAWQYETIGEVILTGTDMTQAVDMIIDDMDQIAALSVRPLHITIGPDATTGYTLAATTGEQLIDYSNRENKADLDSEGGLEMALLHSVAWSLAAVVARVLMFIDSANVEVREAAAPMPKRDRKRAAKRGWPVAATVTIRHRITRRPNTNGNGEGRHFRERFEVIGHYNHVRRGSHVRCGACRGQCTVDLWRAPISREGTMVTVDAPGVYQAFDGRLVNAEPWRVDCAACNGTGLDRERVKPCQRRDQHGNLTCPDGCRREWVPPTVKGDPDAPLRVKTRRVPGPA